MNITATRIWSAQNRTWCRAAFGRPKVTPAIAFLVSDIDSELHALSRLLHVFKEAEKLELDDRKDHDDHAHDHAQGTGIAQVEGAKRRAVEGKARVSPALPGVPPWGHRTYTSVKSWYPPMVEMI